MLVRNIALISDGRTSHGIYKLILNEIIKSKNLKYTYIVTGSHLDFSYGNSINLIKKEKYKISYKFSLPFNSNNEKNNIKILLYYIKKISFIIQKTKIDIFLGQGDRIITLAAAIACAYSKIPFAHMHGGEKSGTFDETVRHTITKLSDFHFPSTKLSFDRILKLGEIKKNIYLTGSPAVEFIKKAKLLNMIELFKKLKIKLVTDYAVFLYNPDNTRKFKNKEDVEIIISNLLEYNFKIIIIYPNNDPYSKDIIKYYNIIKTKHKNKIILIKNLPFQDFLSLLKYAKFLIGNSSGGVIETPTIGIPNLLVGSRQIGRELSPNTLLSKIHSSKIKDIIDRSIYNKKFLKICSKKKTPYYFENRTSPSKKIIKVLEKIDLSNIKDKQISY